MGRPTGFLEYPREETKERSPLKRLSDWKEYSEQQPEDMLKRQSARCMDCGTPFCHIGIEINGAAAGCPINNLIPEWNDLVYRGKWKEALDRLLKTNNFPEFTGRVCPAPCEGSCTVELAGPAVTIKNIERAIIDKGFENGWIQPRIPTKRSGKKIAIVGSGPAGLAAADQLNQAGHSVTVYERDNLAGGLLTYGIPNMKLDKDIVKRRITLLRQEGIDFILNTEIGKDVMADELNEQFDAVILCTGAQKQRNLELEGREAEGVHFAMKYLTQSTKRLLGIEVKEPIIDAEGKNVIVIGGGDTGADCVATALRQKCKSVVQFGKHPKLPNARSKENMWPEQPNIFTMDYAYEEATAQFGHDPREYSVQTKKIVSDSEGHLKELHTIQMKRTSDENGNIVFKEIEGTEQVWPADLVFIAIGFEGTEHPVLKQFGVETKNNKVKAKHGDYKTNLNGVFAAGDSRRGQSLIVWAIQEGRECAREVDKYLMGASVLP
ncbi:glutamate synthase subunit beta [Fictibacillus barbaricus]|uniref:Glutamate synthase (NADPH/NADH) small chain n=1 Tax=Fictibacillus barbaricus TaxID=182136 RepID=A0ABU1TYT3_9BACL|nr:glutamate synthase subunit beta [Fictibacillus barbaricus]MDR7072378.1 glutamate synthase (NADPH/NADH) small chain [Fictibacillus barbaricus]